MTTNTENKTNASRILAALAESGDDRFNLLTEEMIKTNFSTFNWNVGDEFILRLDMLNIADHSGLVVAPNSGLSVSSVGTIASHGINRPVTFARFDCYQDHTQEYVDMIPVGKTLERYIREVSGDDNNTIEYVSAHDLSYRRVSILDRGKDLSAEREAQHTLELVVDAVGRNLWSECTIPKANLVPVLKCIQDDSIRLFRYLILNGMWDYILYIHNYRSYAQILTDIDSNYYYKALVGETPLSTLSGDIQDLLSHITVGSISNAILRYRASPVNFNTLKTIALDGDDNAVMDCMRNINKYISIKVLGRGVNNRAFLNMLEDSGVNTSCILLDNGDVRYVDGLRFKTCSVGKFLASSNLSDDTVRNIVNCVKHEYELKWAVTPAEIRDVYYSGKLSEYPDMSSCMCYDDEEYECDGMIPVELYGYTDGSIQVAYIVDSGGTPHGRAVVNCDEYSYAQYYGHDAINSLLERAGYTRDGDAMLGVELPVIRVSGGIMCPYIDGDCGGVEVNDDTLTVVECGERIWNYETGCLKWNDEYEEYEEYEEDDEDW